MQISSKDQQGHPFRYEWNHPKKRLSPGRFRGSPSIGSISIYSWSFLNIARDSIPSLTFLVLILHHDACFLGKPANRQHLIKRIPRSTGKAQAAWCSCKGSYVCIKPAAGSILSQCAASCAIFDQERQRRPITHWRIAVTARQVKRANSPSQGAELCSWHANLATWEGQTSSRTSRTTNTALNYSIEPIASLQYFWQMKVWASASALFEHFPQGAEFGCICPSLPRSFASTRIYQKSWHCWLNVHTYSSTQQKTLPDACLALGDATRDKAVENDSFKELCLELQELRAPGAWLGTVLQGFSRKRDERCLSKWPVAVKRMGYVHHLPKAPELSFMPQAAIKFVQCWSLLLET